VLVLFAPIYVAAQDDLGTQDEIPLGDLARQLRGSKPPAEDQVIDNDNIERIMDKAESQRLDEQPIFAVRSGVFTAVSPDGSCSLTFDARSANRTQAAYISTDLPQSELARLEGPADIRDGQLAISLHNGTQWDLKELVVGISLLPERAGPAEYRFATLESGPVLSMERASDETSLYHLKGSAAPDSTTVFRTAIEPGFAEVLAQKDWHWAIVGARGIPPAAPAAAVTPSAASPDVSKGGAETSLPGQAAMSSSVPQVTLKTSSPASAPDSSRPDLPLPQPPR
jgi:hypothetical protein